MRGARLLAVGLVLTGLAARALSGAESAFSQPRPAWAQTPAGPAPTPTAAPRPSLEMEGQGSIAPTGNCSAAACPGSFTASLSGPPLGKVKLHFNLSVEPKPDAFTGCHEASGAGVLYGLTISFVGTLCTPHNGGFFNGTVLRYSLRGGVQIFDTDFCVPAMLGPMQTAISGTFDALGEVHPYPGPSPTPTPVRPKPIPNNPIPSGESNLAVVSMIGTSGRLPAPCPSP